MAKFIWFILALGFSMNSFADNAPRIQLTPQEGVYQFPFFESKTAVWNYNNQIPGPVLRAKAGTTLTVNVFNKLSEPTSVHWHGLRIDNAMDGVPGVTQDPIAPGARFQYRLRLQEAGTFWYHPHANAGEQLERGLKGALIVEERRKLPFSQDVVWLLDDWRFNSDGSIFPHFNTHRDLMHDGRWGNAITINGQVKPEITAAPGDRLRLRIINGANARIFSQTFEGLPARVIAVDGRPVTKVFPFKNFILSPGNRIDLDISLPAEAAGKTFYLKDQFTRDTIILGKIKVKDSASRPTAKFDPPLAKDYLPAERFDNLEISKTWDLFPIRGGKFGIGWTMNGRLWPDADTAEVKMGKPIKIEFINTSNRLHPMHLHGTFFRVLEINGEKAAEPFTRDTVLVGPRESIVIGLIPEHKGIWLAHCHIQSHAESGMMTTLTYE